MAGPPSRAWKVGVGIAAVVVALALLGEEDQQATDAPVLATLDQLYGACLAERGFDVGSNADVLHSTEMYGWTTVVVTREVPRTGVVERVELRVNPELNEGEPLNRTAKNMLFLCGMRSR